ncbi:MAG: Ig-like domain-containing protein, partial [archaeon]|nr:Ig-like domain-containing protein [archaeon]
MNARSILGIAILAAVGLVAVTAMSLTMTPGDREGFGLTGDRMVILVGEDEGIEAYRLPSGGTYADIRWSSADTSVATVDGGTVRGISLGETTVRAEISANGRTYSDECRVTVAASKTSEHRAYDVFSDARDYAVLSGDGFDSGILALTFNSLHHIVVSMPGYKDVWTTRTDGTGCV